MDFDASEQVNALAQMPAPPPSPPVGRSAWRLPDTFTRAAVAEGAAGAIELGTAAYRSMVQMRDATPEQRKRMDAVGAEGIDGKNEVSRSLRNVAADLRPDPASASQAEQIVFDLGRGLTKAVGYVATMGPAGLAAFAADEGLTETDRLQRQGVDDITARSAGTVAAMSNLAAGFVPVAGAAKGYSARNIATVTGLAAVSGPAAFVAQQQLTRDILSRADYGKLAMEYDPLDPVGLALSIAAPAIFGGFALRGGRARPEPAAGTRAPAAEQPAADALAPPTPEKGQESPQIAPTNDQIDAAMVHNLTLQQDLRERGSDMIPAADNLTPEQVGIESRFRDQLLRDPQAALDAYARLPETAGGKIVNTDEARELSADYAASRDSRALHAAAVHEPASWLAKRQWEVLLAAPPQTGKVLMLGGAGGSGKTSGLEQLVPGYAKDYDAIFDGTLANPDKAIELIDQALATGRTVEVNYTGRDPFEAIARGVIPRAQRQGRTVPLGIAAKAHEDVPVSISALLRHYAGDDRVNFRVVDNTRGAGKARFSTMGQLPKFDYNNLSDRVFAEADRALAKGEIDEVIYRGLVAGRDRQAGTGLQETVEPGTTGISGRVEQGGDAVGREATPGADGAGQEVAPGAGRPAVVVTERGLTVPVRYRVMDASQLVTSHTDDLTPAADFPPELQPRDRSRSASADQIARIENQIRPELLAESVKASDGAPIVGPDGVVESGNARTIALRRAYGSGKADEYRAWLTANAGRFGIDPKAIEGMRRPVLVRERTGDIDRAEFARQANESAIANLAPAEQAKADAARLVDLSAMVANDDGTLNMAKSGPFVREFMRAAVAPTERGGMLQADGRLSQAGQQRIRNAIFAKAYGDAELVAMLAESTDSNVRNVLAGLLRAAPDVARLRDLISAGARPDMDIATGLVQAVKEFSKLREDGMKVRQYLSQGSLLDAGPAPELAALLHGLEENSRSPKRIGEMIRQMVDAVDQLGDPRQAGLLDDAPPTRAAVTEAAMERMRTLTDDDIIGNEQTLPKTAPVDPLVESIADRVAAVELGTPDLPVRVAEDGQKITASEEMARVTREAAEGTDDQLGALDADLIMTAVNCALSGG